ncbi:unnamed protein product [Absidia cylindrospora]
MLDAGSMSQESSKQSEIGASGDMEMIISSKKDDTNSNSGDGSNSMQVDKENDNTSQGGGNSSMDGGSSKKVDMDGNTSDDGNKDNGSKKVDMDGNTSNDSNKYNGISEVDTDRSNSDGSDNKGKDQDDSNSHTKEKDLDVSSSDIRNKDNDTRGNNGDDSNNHTKEMDLDVSSNSIRNKDNDACGSNGDGSGNKGKDQDDSNNHTKEMDLDVSNKDNDARGNNGDDIGDKKGNSNGDSSNREMTLDDKSSDDGSKEHAMGGGNMENDNDFEMDIGGADTPSSIFDVEENATTPTLSNSVSLPAKNISGTTNKEGSIEMQHENTPIPSSRLMDTITKSPVIEAISIDSDEIIIDNDNGIPNEVSVGSPKAMATVATVSVVVPEKSTKVAPSTTTPSTISSTAKSKATESVMSATESSTSKNKMDHSIDIPPPPSSSSISSWLPQLLGPLSPDSTPSTNDENDSDNSPCETDPPTIDNTGVIHNQGAIDKEMPKVAINALTNDSQPIYIHPHFLKYLKKHQINGIRFMWKQVIGEANGCVLAHCMGLGKTIQVIVLVATIFQEIEKGNMTIPGDSMGNKVLIIAPLITLANWLNEFDKWLPPDIMSKISHIFNSAELAGVHEDRRVQYIRKWYNDGGIMLMSYDQFRNLLTSVRQVDYEDMLLKPSVVILDEAHRIKTPTASVTKCVNMIQTPRRICLTGYPLQNNLAEYYCMIDFIYPGLLVDEQSFKRDFKKPIESIYADSSASDKQRARKQLLHLQLLTGDVIQRKDATILNQELPGKTEYLLSCRLTPMQYSIYLKLLELCRSGSTPVLLSLMLFRCLCNHPAIFKEALMKNAKNSGMYNHTSNTAALSDTDAEVNDQDEYATVNKFAKKEMRDWKNYGDVDNTDIDNWNQSHKIRMILSISRLCKGRKEKLVIVSHSIVSLNFIQTMLSVNGFAVARIDGSTPQGERQPIIDRFNDLESSEIMLLSAKAGGIGVNITGANRMILVDSDWNPSHDEQSIGRIYRFGQTKHIFIYRLLSYSTVESIILTQGAHKQGISNRVLDNKASKLVMEKELRQYYRPPEENPASRIKNKLLNKMNDPVLKEALQTQASSVVEVGRMSNLGYNNGGALDRVELTPSTLKEVQISTVTMLRNARFQHRRTFRPHM